MRSILKAALALFSTLVITSVTAGCGPQGCGYQGGQAGSYDYPANYGSSYSRGSDNSGYYDQYGQRYHGDPAYQNYGWQNQNRQGWQNQNRQGWQNQNRQGWQYQDQQGWQNQGWQNHNQQDWDDHQDDEQHGYDYKLDDHPVQDASGQHIRYYGKPGPDYNKGSSSQQSNMQNANYSSNQRNDWNNVAEADAMNGHDDLDRNNMYRNDMNRDTLSHDSMSSSRNVSGGGTTKSTTTSTTTKTEPTHSSTAPAESRW